jgi:hypothetical protein
MFGINFGVSFLTQKITYSYLLIVVHFQMLPSQQQQQQPAKVIIKPATGRTKKPIVSMSKCLTKTPDDEEDDDTQLISRLMPENTRSTTKLDLLRPRTVGVGAKALAINCHKSSISTL